MFSTPTAQAGFFLFSNMSEETASAPENSVNPEASPAPRARRVSTPRPKKAAKTAATKVVDSAEDVSSIPFPVSPVTEPEHAVDAPEQVGGDWPEPEAASNGGAATPAETAKRKRRRRKGKGQSAGPQNAGAPSGDEVHAVAEVRSNENSQENRPRPAPPQQQQRPKIDPELLTKMAWKIYLAEVSEEGVALIGDNDAKDLSRRCFRLAEIFIEEQTRRR